MFAALHWPAVDAMSASQTAQLAQMLAEGGQMSAAELADYVQLAASAQQRHMQMPHQQQQQQAPPPLMMEMEDPEDSDDDGGGRTEKRAGRRKIRIEYIEDKSRRHITFSKRKAGIMKKVATCVQ